jgi:cobalt/nickel transport system permease protein
MHIPDGFLDTKTAIAAAVLSAGGLALAARRASIELPPKRIPLMGLAAAFVFAAQMLNFPVPGGTSGHLVGGVLCSVLLGPSAAVLVVSSVLIVQCLAFSDGGVLALGANIFNMAIVSSVGGYAIYRLIARIVPGLQGRLLATAVASWVATVAAAVVCAGQLSLSHMIPWSVALPAMAYVHMAIGVGEAIITTLVIATIAHARPELLELPEFPSPGTPGEGRVGDWARDADNTPPPQPSPGVPGAGAKRRAGIAQFVLYGLIISLGLAVFVSPLASTLPDGLDHVAEKHQFNDRQTHIATWSPLSDYKLPGIHSPNVSTALAGAIGTVVVFGIGWLMARLLAPRERPDAPLAADSAEASGA